MNWMKIIKPFLFLLIGFYFCFMCFITLFLYGFVFLFFIICYIIKNEDKMCECIYTLIELWELPFYETLEVFDKLSYDRKRFNKFG